MNGKIMAKKITSVTNPTIVEFSKLSTPKVRFLTGLFSVEGEKSLEDILNSYVEIKNIFVTEDYDKIDELPDDKVVIVSEPVMKKLASSDTPPKVLTVAFQQNLDMFDLKDTNRLLLLDGVSDPGNLGTIIRTAVAFGYEGILFANNCCDPYNPKVIRSATGNFFKIPFATVANSFVLKEFRDYQFVMTDLHAGSAHQPEDVPLEDKFILVLGSEAHGISQDILNIPHENVQIYTTDVESLNVATAGAIIMYEFSKRY